MKVAVQVRVLAVDVVCDACGARLDDVPAELGVAWAQGHRDPGFSAVVTTAGRWERGR